MQSVFGKSMRDTYEKAIIFVCLFVFCVVATALSGCATGAGRSDTTGLVLDYQRQVTTLENRLALYESTVGNAISELGAIREQSGSIEGTVDELIYLFGEYQRGVDNLLQQYRVLTETSIESRQDSSDTRNSLWSDDFVEDSGVYTIRKGN